MSAKISGEVWDLRLEKDKKLILLAYVDHADHEGFNIFPTVRLIVWKTGYSEREVQRTTRELETMGLLIADGRTPGGANKWRYPVGKGAEILLAWGAKVAGCQGGTGDSLPVGGGAKLPVEGGAIAMAPELQNVINPQREVDSKALHAWEMVAAQLKLDMDPGSFRNFILPCDAISLENHVLRVAVPDVETGEWMNERLTSTAQRMLVGVLNDKDARLEFVLAEPAGAP